MFQSLTLNHKRMVFAVLDLLLNQFDSLQEAVYVCVSRLGEF